MNFQRSCFLVILFLGVALCADRRYCDAQSECHANECCVNNTPPRGKRFITGGKLGHCVSLGQQKASCYVRYGSASTPPSDLIYGCPCEKPLSCVGSHVVEIPLGEIGSCG